MALDPTILATSIKALLIKMSQNTDQTVSIEVYAAELAIIIDAYIRTGTVTVVGSSVSGGPVSGTGTIS